MRTLRFFCAKLFLTTIERTEIAHSLEIRADELRVASGFIPGRIYGECLIIFENKIKRYEELRKQIM